MLPIVKDITSHIKNDSAWKYYTMDTGHDAMITKPGLPLISVTATPGRFIKKGVVR